jgi:hypothetical protein
VIPGVRSVAEFDANVRLARHRIPREFWTALRERELIDPRAPIPGETGSPSPRSHASVRGATEGPAR